MNQIGTVKNIANDELRNFAGMEFILLSLSIQNEVEVLNPLTIENLEKFYYTIFKKFGKDLISTVYTEFLEYMLSENKEFSICSDIDNFTGVRNIKGDDMKKCYLALREFKDRYGIK